MKKKDKEKALEQKKQEKDNRRSDFTRAVGGSLMLMAIGFLLILRPDLGSAAVAVVVGWTLIGIGAIGILICILSWPVLGWGTLLVSIAAVALGVYLLLNPLTLASLFGIAVGLYLLLFQGFGSLLESLRLRKMGLKFLPNLIVSLVLIVLGAALIFAPLASSRLVMMLFGIGLVISGAINMMLRAWAAGKLSNPKEDPNIIDADED
jgi:uncharacterized membrane protein HdeD (DUF308 family)